MREPVTVTVKDGDSDIRIRITPMPALKAESWLMRAALALGAGLKELDTQMKPEALLGCLLSADYEKVKPLLEELLVCCERVTDSGSTIALNPATIEGVIEYPTTIFTIRVCVLRATFGFFTNGGWQTFLKSLRSALTAIR